MIKSIYPVIGAADLPRARDFYAGLFDLEVVYEADFYVQLQSRESPSLQLGLVAQRHETIPEGHRTRPAGVLATFEVTDVDDVHARAVARDVPIALSLRDEVFGQRHFIAIDPDGLLVDVIQPIDFAPEQEAFIKSARART